jgi:hypothetical protein
LVAEQLQTNGKKRTADNDEEVFDESLTKKSKPGKLVWLEKLHDKAEIRRTTCTGGICLPYMSTARGKLLSPAVGSTS